MKSLSSYIYLAALSTMVPLLSSCITEDFEACPNDYYATFRYDMNLLEADAFGREVGSVSLYAFDAATGKPVFSTSEAGASLGAEGYRMRLDVPPGTYDVVVWGGMKDNASFTPLPPKPARIEELHTAIARGGSCNTQLQPLFHSLRRVTFTDNSLTGSREPQTAGFSLIKDVNRVNIYLLRLDGHKFGKDDFAVRITADNARLNYDNSVEGRVEYGPFATTVIDRYEGMEARGDVDITRPSSIDITRPSAWRAELGFSRLMADAESRLEVVRNSDGKVIAVLPLEPNVLQYRKEFYAHMSPQEYLDRISSADIAFVLTEDNGWNPQTQIYIQKWATVPIQYIDW